LPILKDCYGIRIKQLEFSLFVDQSIERPKPREDNNSLKYNEMRYFNFYTPGDGALSVVDTCTIDVVNCLRVRNSSLPNHIFVQSEWDYDEDISFH
jgi:hypothetical protein